MFKKKYTGTMCYLFEMQILMTGIVYTEPREITTDNSAKQGSSLQRSLAFLDSSKFAECVRVVTIERTGIALSGVKYGK